MLSFDQLPMDDGFLPAGKWLVVLRDNLNDSLAGTSFRDGVTALPVNGQLLKRIVTFLPTVGALRVEGSPCALGDVSRLQAPAPAPVLPAAPPVQLPAALTPAGLSVPTTAAELLGLDDKVLHALCEEMGAKDTKRWSLKALRRFAAEELGIEGVP